MKRIFNRDNLTKFVRRREVIAFVIIVLTWGAAYLIYYRYFGSLPQATLSLFQTLPAPTSSDRIIVFSPHEDDETLGVGGYIAAATKAGADVTVVFATDGNHHNLKQRRERESIAADGILGVQDKNIIFYNYPDTKLKDHHAELIASVDQTLKEVQPTKIFVTDPIDDHPDHHELGATVAAEAKKWPYIQVYTYLIHFDAYPRPQAFRPKDALLPPVRLLETNRQWLKTQLSPDAFDKKNQAVLQYKSQLRTPFLHSLMLSFVRQNEMFSKETP